MPNSPFLELVSKRRSIRKYKQLPVEREKLMLCLEAARLAPSACNAQPYRFIAVDEPALKEKVAKAAFSGIYSACKFAQAAPVLVLVVSQRGKLSAWLGNQVQSTDFRLVDIGIAAEHFVLAAAEQGLGTCWLGVHPRQERMDGVRSLFTLPEHIIPMCGIALGWPAEQIPARTRYKEQVVHMEKW